MRCERLQPGVYPGARRRATLQKTKDTKRERASPQGPQVFLLIPFSGVVAAGPAGAGGAGVAAADFIASVSISSLITFRIIPRSLRSCHGVARGEVVSGQ